jgi:hypothetical protein
MSNQESVNLRARERVLTNDQMREFRDGRPRAASAQAGIRTTPLKTRPKVIGDDMLIFARALKDNGTAGPGDREEAGHHRAKVLPKPAWAILILVGSLLGRIAYLAVERLRDDDSNPPTRKKAGPAESA